MTKVYNSSLNNTLQISHYQLWEVICENNDLQNKKN